MTSILLLISNKVVQQLYYVKLNNSFALIDWYDFHALKNPSFTLDKSYNILETEIENSTFVHFIQIQRKFETLD